MHPNYIFSYLISFLHVDFVLASQESSTKKFPCICWYGTCTTPQLHGNSSCMPWFTDTNNANRCFLLRSVPNFLQDKHEENHQPKLHGGLVIKQNANQRYATNAVTSFIFREIASKHNLPVQVSLMKILSLPLFFLSLIGIDFVSWTKVCLYLNVCSIPRSKTVTCS